MRFALLGADRSSLKLACAALEAGGQLVWQGDLGGAATERPEWLPREDLAASWEDLLDQDGADAVIVGGGGLDRATRAHQLQQLVRLGRPVLTAFPLFPSVLTYHEIELARGDGQGPLLHFNPLLEHPLLGSLDQWVRDGHPEGGAAEQIICQRFLADRSQRSVLDRFARDVEFLDRVAVRLDRVGAHGVDHDAAAYSGLSVQLSGPGKTPATWSPLPEEDEVAMRLTIIFAKGQVTVRYDNDDRPVETSSRFDGDAQAQQMEVGDPARRCVDRFFAAVQQQEAAPERGSSWPSALHAMELADSIEISLRRGRMIDVHNQQLTEELAFRGTMSAAGCGLLLALPPLLIFLGWLAGKLGVPAAEYWPHALLAGLALFLAFQLLPKLFLAKPNE